MTDNKVAKSKREGRNSSVVSVIRRTRPYYFRKCKKISPTNIECLPDELVFHILLQLPAHELYDVVRLVCWRWYRIMCNLDFARAHHQNSTYGLLIHHCYKLSNPIFVAMWRGRIEKFKFNYDVMNYTILDCCNGLVLHDQRKPNGHPLLVSNHATKQRLVLPPTPSGINPSFFLGIRISYVVGSMEYKVVGTYFDKDGSSVKVECAILTVGVDKSWRHVPTQHLSRTARRSLMHELLATEGFMHWTDGNCTGLLTLNVESEIIAETPIPPGYKGRLKYFLSTGRSLTLLISCSQFSWEVWEMKPETGEWMKLPRIDFEAQKCKFEQFGNVHDRPLRPVGWLNYPEMLVFSAPCPIQFCVAFIVRSQEIVFLKLRYDSYSYHFSVQKNSLTWIGDQS